MESVALPLYYARDMQRAIGYLAPSALAVNFITFKYRQSVHLLISSRVTVSFLFRYILTTNFHIGELLKVPFQFNMFNIPATTNKIDVNTLSIIAR